MLLSNKIRFKQSIPTLVNSFGGIFQVLQSGIKIQPNLLANYSPKAFFSSTQNSDAEEFFRSMKQLPEASKIHIRRKSLPYKRIREVKKEEVINTQEIVNFLRNSNCKDIVALDVTNRCTWASNMIIASGLSKPHLKAVVGDFVKKYKKKVIETTGKTIDIDQSPNWIVINLGKLIVHLQDPESREFYDLDSLWVFERGYLSDGDNPGGIVDLQAAIEEREYQKREQEAMQQVQKVQKEKKHTKKEKKIFIEQRNIMRNNALKYFSK